MKMTSAILVVALLGLSACKEEAATETAPAPQAVTETAPPAEMAPTDATAAPTDAAAAPTEQQPDTNH